MPTHQPKLHALFDRTRFFRHAKTQKQPSVHLTPRDERLLEMVYRYRVIDTATLRALMRHEASPHALWRRLRQLWRAGYLDRPPEALYLIKFTGQETNLVWALGRQGYAALARTLNLPMDNHQSRRMTQLNQEIKASSLAHDLASNRGRACIELASAQHPQVRLVFWSTKHIKFAITMPERQRRLFPATPRRFAVVADGLFSVEHVNEPPPNRSHFYYEYDRGTTPTPRWLLRKGVGYGEFLTSGDCSRQRGFAAFRVLIMAHTPRRKETLRDAMARWLTDAQHQGFAYPENLWWFTDQTQLVDLARPERALAPIWQTATSEEKHSLLE